MDWKMDRWREKDGEMAEHMRWMDDGHVNWFNC